MDQHKKYLHTLFYSSPVDDGSSAACISDALVAKQFLVISLLSKETDE